MTQTQTPLTPENFDYELIDCGFGQKIERFGNCVMTRPCPQATWKQKKKNFPTPINFVRTQQKNTWTGIENLPATWNLKIGHIKAELRFSPNGQVGIFPEQFDNWQCIQTKVTANHRKKLKILNGFAYTGMSTLFASAEHTEVVHVDGSKSALNWAKKNAELSGLQKNNIRWICDDVIDFMQREVRRGHKYDGIILDPPAFGRGEKKTWKIERDLPMLIELMNQLLVQHPVFVILTCHAPEHFSAKDLAKRLESLRPFRHTTAEAITLKIKSKRGHDLPASFGARVGS